MAISRLLQGFEIVLLSVLVRFILEIGAVSLDHDGVLVAFIGKRDSKQIALNLTKKMEPWSKYLLGQPIPIDAKSPIYQWRGNK